MPCACLREWLNLLRDHSSVYTALFSFMATESALCYDAPPEASFEARHRTPPAPPPAGSSAPAHAAVWVRSGAPGVVACKRGLSCDDRRARPRRAQAVVRSAEYPVLTVRVLSREHTGRAPDEVGNMLRVELGPASEEDAAALPETAFACPQACGFQGACMRDRRRRDAFCRNCASRFLSSDCTQGDFWCPNACRGKGECVQGVCLCQAGFWCGRCPSALSRGALLARPLPSRASAAPPAQGDGLQQYAGRFRRRRPPAGGGARPCPGAPRGALCSAVPPRSRQRGPLPCTHRRPPPPRRGPAPRGRASSCTTCPRASPCGTWPWGGRTRTSGARRGR